MYWRQEPRFSRILVLAGVLLSGLVALSILWASDLPPRSLWFPIVLFAWLTVVLVIASVAIFSSGRILLNGPHRRPARFDVTPGRFSVRPLLSPGVTNLLQLMVYGFFIGQLVHSWERAREEPDGWIWVLPQTVLLGLYTLLVVLLCIGAWRGGPSVELTPAGLLWRTPLLTRNIPWEALATGGPGRTGKGWAQHNLRLVTTRPELVTQRGWAVGAGSKAQPVISLQFDAHPWLVADAIRWYAEHPEDRAAIGTQAEHDRLIAAVTGDYAQPETPRPAKPLPVKVAVWLTYVGAAWGLLMAGVNLFIALAFEDRILAAERALALEEERITGEAVGESLFPAQPVAILGLVLGLVGALLAVLLVRHVSRGSGPGRVGLTVLSGLVVVYAMCGGCIGWPGAALLDSPNQDSIAALMLLIMMGDQAVRVCLVTTVMILLYLPISNAYFRPPAVVQV